MINSSNEDNWEPVGRAAERVVQRLKAKMHDDQVLLSIPVSIRLAAAVDKAALSAGKSRERFLSELLYRGFPEATGPR
jgi:hypothetical protein